MAKTISQLTDATTVNASDELIIQQGGITKRATGSELSKSLNTINSTVNAKDFGAVGNGSADDTAAIQAALNSLGSLGGTVFIGNLRCVIGTTLTVPPNCHLVGPHTHIGTPSSNSSAPYQDVGGALLVASSATIALQSGASIKGLFIYRNGMTFPAPNSQSFAGTAVTASGDDCSVSSCQIMGFEYAFYSHNYQRARLNELNIDCQNGIHISLCYDIPKLINIHCWPFATIANTGFPAAEWYQRHWRTGKGFYLHSTVDGPMLANCFAYGYNTGFHFKNVAMVCMTNCVADNTPISVVSRPGSVGFHFEGFINGCLASGCVAFQHEIGAWCNLADSFTQLAINNFFFSGQELAGIKIDEGIVDVTDVYFLAASSALTRYGVYVTSASPDVRVDFCTFRSVSNPIHTTTANDDLLIGSSNMNTTNVTSMVSGTVRSRPVNSASNLLLPSSGTTYRILGTTNINTISSGWAGREVTLVFADALTVANGTGAIDSVRLNGGTNFSVSAGSTLTLKHNGIQWFEIGRCL